MSTSKLFEPIKAGSITLGHRVVMAPLTRYRCDDAGAPTPMMKEYYKQRASIPGTLIISEGTLISPSSGDPVAHKNAPGIFNSAHVAAWRKVTDAVHENGSFIYCQLWHFGGRIGFPEFGKITETSEYLKFVAADRMSEGDIQKTIGDFATAAKNAIAAGFDGVQVHIANGYLLDQFLHTTYNHRTDEYGGNIEKRVRFPLEVIKVVVDAVGADRTCVRLSPFFSDSLIQTGVMTHDPYPQLEYLIRQLKPLKLAFLELIEVRMYLDDADFTSKTYSNRFLIELWDNQSPVILTGGFGSHGSPQKAVDETWKEYDVCVAIGRYFISNPDLVFRLKEGIEFAPYDRSTFYTRGQTKGYIDYPFSKKFLNCTGDE
ncbi:NADH:flavin oxidoreductase/NADH oxidase [Hypoxylon trugodes]|uniref:NADH:flavin oxidoreductase/NADH oxidase n=1 Tax=Hypoxylon trugodes TaxID=326681 RepID=UPI0021970A27|nr:NADH:flavin oxidoreductase/NADH oxidase [Hypoxylon trugodes]KAI1384301.1 NADH:flavin oxidoreductase/NADH oxidase [Hypoxylon trugodes]